jgi:hypothetical protein
LYRLLINGLNGYSLRRLLSRYLLSGLGLNGLILNRLGLLCLYLLFRLHVLLYGKRCSAVFTEFSDAGGCSAIRTYWHTLFPSPISFPYLECKPNQTNPFPTDFIL